MFKKLAHLLFGGQQENSEDVKSEEVVEEEWLVVSHQEEASAGPQTLETPTTLSHPAPDTATITQVDTDASTLDPESERSTDQSKETDSKSGVIAALLSPPKALQELTKLKKSSMSSHHHMSRNVVQRHNRVRQGFQNHSFPLQQPGHRTLSH
ncbi:tumor protein p53-inducible nuclear protein 2 [Nerophis lumbriciformis]|uniref:tumor protein p53-inducible nuclear protein 2 n=1 Tax=Nerophis lumbriciformis TaxID=546530 RepID=UPI003BA9FE5A